MRFNLNILINLNALSYLPLILVSDWLFIYGNAFCLNVLFSYLIYRTDLVFWFPFGLRLFFHEYILRHFVSFFMESFNSSFHVKILYFVSSFFCSTDSLVHLTLVQQTCFICCLLCSCGFCFLVLFRFKF